MSANYYGSQHTRKRARDLLTAQRISDTVWLVTGGELGHGVEVHGDTFTCDCRLSDPAIDEMCSHILAVWLTIHGDFEKPWAKDDPRYVSNALSQETAMLTRKAKRGGNSSAAER